MSAAVAEKRSISTGRMEDRVQIPVASGTGKRRNSVSFQVQPEAPPRRGRRESFRSRDDFLSGSPTSPTSSAFPLAASSDTTVLKTVGTSSTAAAAIHGTQYGPTVLGSCEKSEDEPGRIQWRAREKSEADRGARSRSVHSPKPRPRRTSAVGLLADLTFIAVDSAVKFVRGEDKQVDTRNTRPRQRSGNRHQREDGIMPIVRG